jgi:dienelactone hydrolase
VPESTGRLEWLGEEASAGCIERSFLIRRLPAPVPGVVWSPRATVPRATVLLNHGGSGNKRSERHLRMGRRLASAGLAVIAIDGPYHGDRVAAPMAPSAYQRLIVAEGIEAVTARMTADWLDAVSALAGLGFADAAHVSVFGMSMGARFGLPVAAALGPRLQCAVLGKLGARQAAPLHPGLLAPRLMMAAARAVSAPVLYHVQWDDEIFPRDGQFELFNALTSTDKRLIARPGPHAQTHPDDQASWQDFIMLNTPHATRLRLQPQRGESIIRWQQSAKVLRRSLVDHCLSGLQVKDEPSYPVPQVVAIGLSVAVEMTHPVVVRPEKVNPCVPGLRHGPFKPAKIRYPRIPAARRDVGVIAHVRPEMRFLGKFGDERPVDDQHRACQGDAPDDQVIPVSYLADVEIEWVCAWVRSHAISVLAADPEAHPVRRGRNSPGDGQATNCKWPERGPQTWLAAPAGDS